jgi:hypothetical protein
MHIFDLQGFKPPVLFPVSPNLSGGRLGFLVVKTWGNSLQGVSSGWLAENFLVMWLVSFNMLTHIQNCSSVVKATNI